jgi:hypothetical protein
VQRTRARFDQPRAGIVDPQPLAETTEVSFDKVFAINSRGLAFTVKKAPSAPRNIGRILPPIKTVYRAGESNNDVPHRRHLPPSAARGMDAVSFERLSDP